ncbi:AhpA/YtjB family protein, partial [Pantoea sp.]|uniref:AhpA/YtjB family protein n=1 Tax=Pantoea sp. TaxID=69393 RepID=UPI0028ACC5AE
MVKTALKFRLHRTVIVLISLALLVVLMQGASWFSLGHQMARSEQVDELARTLTKQVAFSLQPLMDNSDDNRPQIEAILHQLTDNSRILDASVYDDDGSLVAHSGENINV